jgi:pilus assembly protein Flp/PilA
MKMSLLKLWVMFECLTVGEEGQDLVEYALLMIMISLALISAVKGIASSVTSVFTNVSSSIAAA